MTQEEFERLYAQQWETLETLLATPPRRRWRRKSSATPTTAAGADMPFLYRQICQHLALARDRHYSSHLIERLNQLALRGHQALYTNRFQGWGVIRDFIREGFPQAVRANARWVGIAAALFYGPGLILLFTAWLWWPNAIYTLMDAERVAEIESMYRPGVDTLGREAGSDMLMFGYYIRNNIGIAFQSFAGGLLFGVGTLFFMVYNGLYIGAVAGHLTYVGYTSTFWPFVIGHGAFELTAIVLAGAAGLKLGAALIASGRLRRSEALRVAAREAIKIMYGVIIFLTLAAGLEAFWSSSTLLEPSVKYSVGALLWLAVGAYLFGAGRSRAA